MKFSIIICGYNEEANIGECLQSCLDLDYPKNNYEIVYVDNDSSDDSIKIAEKYPINIFIETKRGPSEARNRGIKESKGEILLFLDADTNIDANYLKMCESGTFLKTNVGAGVGKVLPLTKSWVADYLGVSLFEGYPRFIKHKYMRGCPSCNLAIRRDTIQKIGYFKEGLKSAEGITRFAEDKDICERIRKANYKILYNPETFIYHENCHKLKDLFSVWIKGSRWRATLIKFGGKDPFTLVFKYNLPLTYILLLITFLIYYPLISFLLFALGLLGIYILSVKSCIETGLVFQSLFIKPFMDVLSLLVINFSVIYSRWKHY